MLRLTTPKFERFVQSESFDVVYGGGEANIAVSLTNYGYDGHLVSRLPKHEIGQAAINLLRRFDINTDYVARDGDFNMITVAAVESLLGGDGSGRVQR